MVNGDVSGPFFISIGDEEKLSAFLEKNPSIPREQAFVDDYTFNQSIVTCCYVERYDVSLLFNFNFTHQNGKVSQTSAVNNYYNILV